MLHRKKNKPLSALLGLKHNTRLRHKGNTKHIVQNTSYNALSVCISLLPVLGSKSYHFHKGVTRGAESSPEGQFQPHPEPGQGIPTKS